MNFKLPTSEYILTMSMSSMIDIVSWKKHKHIDMSNGRIPAACITWCTMLLELVDPLTRDAVTSAALPISQRTIVTRTPAAAWRRVVGKSPPLSSSTSCWNPCRFTTKFEPRPLVKVTSICATTFDQICQNIVAWIRGNKNPRCRATSTRKQYLLHSPVRYQNSKATQTTSDEQRLSIQDADWRCRLNPIAGLWICC